MVDSRQGLIEAGGAAQSNVSGEIRRPRGRAVVMDMGKAPMVVRALFLHGGSPDR